MNPITESKFLSDNERDQLLATLAKYSTRDSLLLQLILYTGARGCEILKLRSQDFSFTHLGGTVTVKGAKGSNDRTIPLPSKLSTDLQKFLAGLAKGVPPFDISTRQLRNIWDQYRPNPNKGVHCLRHTAGVLLFLNCRDILVVKAFLGHKSITNTMVYLDFVLGARELKKHMKGMWGQKVMG